MTVIQAEIVIIEDIQDVKIKREDAEVALMSSKFFSLIKQRYHYVKVLT